LEIIDSTVSGNIADEGGWGGGILNYSNYTWATGYVTITNATLSANLASRGGGIDNDDRATTTIANTTITNNFAAWGGGISRSGDVNATILIGNSINANNLDLSQDEQDCQGGLTSNGYNLFGLGTGCPTGGIGDIFTADPLLGPLSGNGGDTRTHGLLLGSPAIDAGDPAGCSDPWGRLLTTDQRGHPRPLDGDGDGATVCDIGAYEYLLVPVSVSDVAITGSTAGDVGVALSFTAAVSPISATLPISYAWQATDQPPVNHTGGLTDTATFAWDTPGDYELTITATNAYGSVTDTQTVTIAEIPISGLEAGNDGPTVLGVATTLSATVSSGSNVTYNWAFGDGVKGSDATAAHTYAAPGTYMVVVTATNSAGQETATTAVDVDAPITGLAAAHDGPTTLGESTLLTATVTVGSRVSYAWDFGDGQVGAGPSVNHIYSVPGTYTVTVTAANAVSELTTTTTVSVYERSRLVYLPFIINP
jgi:PKD repeat protein